MKSSEGSWQSRTALQGSAKDLWLKLSIISSGSGSKTSNTIDKRIRALAQFRTKHRPNSASSELYGSTSESDSDDFDYGDRACQRKQLSQRDSSNALLQLFSRFTILLLALIDFITTGCSEEFEHFFSFEAILGIHSSSIFADASTLPKQVVQVVDIVVPEGLEVFEAWRTDRTGSAEWDHRETRGTSSGGQLEKCDERGTKDKVLNIEDLEQQEG